MTQSKTVLITGASRGIGRACAERFLAGGFRVALACCRNAAATAEFFSDSPGVCVFSADLTDERAVLALCEQVRAQMGEVDAIVNNAGISLSGLFQDSTTEEYERVMALHVRAPYLISRFFCPEMIARRAGSIVNVSSVWGQTGASMEVLYSTSKAALIGMTKALAKELAPSKVRVNCVCPGAVDTDMMADYTEAEISQLCEQIPLSRLATPAEIAECVFFLSTESAAYVTGQLLSPNGGLYI